MTDIYSFNSKAFKDATDEKIKAEINRVQTFLDSGRIDKIINEEAKSNLKSTARETLSSLKELQQEREKEEEKRKQRLKTMSEAETESAGKITEAKISAMEKQLDLYDQEAAKEETTTLIRVS